VSGAALTKNLSPPIGSKWVFKVKSNGIYRARLVALGYSQVAGIDFTDNFAPVIDEITFRILLILKLRKQWYGEIIDVESAFLYGKLQEEIYLRIPQGLNQYENLPEDSNDCCLLERSMYGLVQGARVWWKEFTTTLRKRLNFLPCLKDHCLFKRDDENGIVFFCVYVDDCCVIGDKKAVKIAIKEVAAIYTIKLVGPINEYVGCTVETTEREDSILLSQPDLLNKIQRTFNTALKSVRTTNTPAGTNDAVLRPTPDDILLSPTLQTEYRSGVGMLLFLIKHSRPDISNSVRELTKVMDGATSHHYLQMLRLIKYVVKTKHRKLLLAPKKNADHKWVIKAYSDSDFSGDKNNRKSITGYIIYLYGSPIAWKSRGQKSVTLSSTEAEYVALSEVATEIIFVRDIIVFMGIPVELPIVVHVDNVGAIYLSNKAGSTTRTKHVDTRYHYFREYIEDGVLLVRFVRTDENDADIFTKNLGTEKYEKHSTKYMVETAPK
jgi:hypothetical protein